MNVCEHIWACSALLGMLAAATPQSIVLIGLHFRAGLAGAAAPSFGRAASLVTCLRNENHQQYHH